MERTETLGEVVDRVRGRTQLSFTERDVERILSALQASDDIWRIIDLSDVPMMALCEALSAMREVGWVTWESGGIQLTTKGREVCRSLSVAKAVELRCPKCGGRGIELGPVAEIAQAFHRIVRDRPDAIQEFDQGYVTEDSTLYRVAFMWARGDVVGKEVIVLGDDDLVSVALALTRAPRRVVMVDIDQRIVQFVALVAKDEGLAIEPILHDLREPLPKRLHQKFDAFFCDPTESLRGFLAFANRGLSALSGPGRAGYLGLTRREASLAKWWAIQRELLAAGASITDILDDFHTYVNWPYIETMRIFPCLPVRRLPKREEPWYRSALIRIELVKPAKADDRRLTDDIFFDDEAATI